MRAETFRILLFSVYSLFLATAAAAQSSSPGELAGARFDSPAARVVDSNATYSVGLTLDGGATYSSSARLSDSVRIIGRVRPEAEHVGLRADIFVVDRVNLVFMMKNPDGNFVAWNGRVPDLVPFREDVTLTPEVEVDVYTGLLGEAGDHRIFLGYLPVGGNLRYTPAPHRLSITDQTPSEQAYSLFVSTISPNILQSRCSECHVSGGLAHAGGAYHIFRLPLASSLETNFWIFQGLVNLRGVDYILTKVTGGNAHGGGVQLTSSSADYADLREFLQLVAQDLPDELPPPQYGASSAGGGGTGGEDPDPAYPDPYAQY